MTNPEMERAIEFLVTHAADQSAQAAAQSAKLDKLIVALEQDAENIRALARIAELHHERLTRLEGGEGDVHLPPR